MPCRPTSASCNGRPSGTPDATSVRLGESDLALRLPHLRRGVPARIRTTLGIPDSEHCIAWGSGPTGTDPSVANHVAATTHALYVESPHEVIFWEQVTKAHWDEPVLDLVITGPDGDSRKLALRLDHPRGLPAAVHARVTESVVVSEVVELDAGEKVRLVARRDAGGDIVWSIVYDASLDPADPALQAKADAALADLRASLGV